MDHLATGSGTQPVAKALQVVVEVDHVGLAAEEIERGDAPAIKLHRVLWGSTGEARTCFLVAVPGVVR
jgi:hypothetical protein